ncbi:uncharacterized protein LOC106645801 [Copidosoma floridanum]|uniref:uncharacterized protein LOC106645801 n=1 Tax=Copidosoma floridanum TaxID=29053 RepID=UPI0006C9CFE8|nr:uncharacterized protein LOC106645801 [Copidosoma floridanum]
MENHLWTSSSDSDQLDQSQENGDALSTKDTKRKKDPVEEIKRKSLAAKRNLRTKSYDLKKPKTTTFMRNLNKFAAHRKAVVDATQCPKLLLSEPEIKHKRAMPQPLQKRGFFLSGVKGKEVSRSFEDQNKVKNAILNNDILQLLQSGSRWPAPPAEPSNEDTDLEIQLEVAKVLKKSSDNSPSIDCLLSSGREDKFSPILSKAKTIKNQNLKKPATNRVQALKPPRIDQPPVREQLNNDEKYKRRLFEAGKHFANSEHSHHLRHNDAPFPHSMKQSTPKSVIYFTDLSRQKQEADRSYKKYNGINPMNQQTIRCYMQTCKTIADEKFGKFSNIFRNVRDPLESAKAALKSTYANSLKEFLEKQNAAGTSTPNDSEIMIEPDSAIPRAIRNNIRSTTKSVAWNPDNYSSNDFSSNDFDDLDLLAAVDAVDNSFSNKKLFSSAEKSLQSERTMPLSTRANVDPTSVNIKLKIDSVDKNRQELVARYLNDVSQNNARTKQESVPLEGNKVKINTHYLNNDKLFITNDGVAKTYLNRKSTKHVPTILRKNRSQGDYVEKEKVGNGPNLGKTNAQTSGLDFRIGSKSVSQHTCNYKSEFEKSQMLKAVKSSFVPTNVKYSQPMRIDLPLAAGQSKKILRNAVALESPKRLLFESKNHVGNHFVLPQNNFCVSAIDQRNNCMDNRQDFHQYRLSKEYSELSNLSFPMCQSSQGDSMPENNCMLRMISFGDIQERTNRLTLLSSQSQSCSQRNGENIYFSQNERHNLYSNPQEQQYDSANNTFNSQLCSSFTKVATPQFFNIPMHSTNCSCCSHNYVNSNETQYLSSQNGFNIITSNNNHPMEEANSIVYPVNDYQVYDSQSTCAPVQHKNPQQAVKFIAVGDNNVPQRRPVYRMHENDCARKVSNPSQQYAIMTKPVYSENVSNQARYAASIPSLRYYEQGTIINPDFEYSNNNNHVINKQISSNVERLLDLDNQDSISNGNHFVVNGMPSHQILINNQSMPMHPVARSQNYIEQEMLVQKQLSQNSQRVGCQPLGYYVNNEPHSVNNAYLQQMNHRVLHQNRS